VRLNAPNSSKNKKRIKILAVVGVAVCALHFPMPSRVSVGAVYSDVAAASLAKLIEMVGWKTDVVKDLVADLFVHYPEQEESLYHQATALHRRLFYNKLLFKNISIIRPRGE
jgi:hypothetical protein